MNGSASGAWAIRPVPQKTRSVRVGLGMACPRKRAAMPSAYLVSFAGNRPERCV